MNIESIEVGEFQANCHLAWGEAGKAIVIDPGSDAEMILSSLDNNGLEVASYMLTHGHVDHISALAELHAARPAPIGIHPLDLEWAFEKNNDFPPFYPAPLRPGEIVRKLHHQQVFNDAGLQYQVIATPGHSPGCVCFYFPKDNVLFTGDTLFAGSIGRTDLPGGDIRRMNESLKIFTCLPEKTKVYTGHGPSTTIAAEKKNNYFIQSLLAKQERIHE